MKNKLIADAGSTKVEWIVLSPNGSIKSRTRTDGLNALLADSADVTESFRNARSALGDADEFESIDYYGAGCATERVCSRITELLAEVWHADQYRVHSDLLGAARALFGHASGIACILGTGSNSCLYDGKKITFNVPSLGYVMGDEGSGSALGKRLIADAFKGQLPQLIREKFIQAWGMSLSDILDRIYRTPAPNKFLASVVPFIADNLWNPYIYAIVLKEFDRFFRRNVAMYKGSHSLPVSFIGSIAVEFEPILREAADSQGFAIKDVTRSPIDGLIKYHSDNF